MAYSNRIAFIGNSLPRRCGIATFTNDLEHAIATSRSAPATAIVAMTDHGRTYDYPSNVLTEINEDKIGDYARAADFLNAGKYDVVSLQHEFGIFGGESGDYISTLLSRLDMPVVTTFHTVLRTPSKSQRAVMDKIVGMSAKVVTMAEKGRELLRTIYRVPADKIDVIPHGIPDCGFAEPDAAKAKLGFAGKTVILTFGLLSPNKGIDVVIEAMPAILKRRPDAVYVVLGATHPHLIRDRGEAYRESLIARAAALGVQDSVVFLDCFVDRPTLLDYISMCDVYVTPYLNEAQMTSGTLAYSFGLGKAVVSTPYWHARELLADGHGVLVPFADSEAIGAGISDLLADDVWRKTLRTRAYSASRGMTWERTAERYLTTFASAQRKQPQRVVVPPMAIVRSVPEPRTAHLMAMCDDTGILQHAIHAVPDRLHGYCVDDNARALIFACDMNKAGEQPLPDVLVSRLASFVQNAWNPDTHRFRNFMGYDRAWLEDRGSDDSQGRSLWALGVCAAGDASASRRNWAASLFSEALPLIESLGSPRAWAFTLLGLDAYLGSGAEDPAAARIRDLLVDRAMAILSGAETKEWVWFEEGLSYDNARLAQAAIVTGIATASASTVEAGLRTLRWLMTMQTTPEGLFRPVGSDSFGDRRQIPRAFDQQPLEATATIAACRAAYRADGNTAWKNDAARAFAWFMGGNDLSVPVAEPDTGACRDGLHPDRANENRGAESTLSYLMALTDMRQLARATDARIGYRGVLAMRA
jgi:glycosyltransferase involved in cell wall biosynthesis